MIALLPLLLAAGQADPTIQAPPPVVTLALPPADWSDLPPLRFDRPWSDWRALSAYVVSEVRAGRCAASGPTLRVDLAVLVAAGGQIRRIVPRAIQCPTVEQYASGLTLRMARGNVAPPPADSWFQTTLIFTLR